MSSRTGSDAGSVPVDAAPVVGGPSFLLNGETLSLEGVDPHESLLEIVRRNGITGPKEGCAEGDCGACTVSVRQSFATGSAYRAVVSCIVLAGQLPGAEVWTAESLSPAPGPDGSISDLHPVQAAIADSGGSQCGYCTPGIAMSLFASYYTPVRQSTSIASDPAGETLAGNLCRCTGYRSLREASATLATAGVNRQGDPFASRLAQPMPPRPAASVVGGGVIAFRPTTVEEALALRAENPQARVVAGATDVGVEISRGGMRFPAFIMLGSISAMRGVSRDDAGTRIGACVTMTELKSWIPAEQFPTVHKVLPWFGSRQIRNRATVGGNLMTASPIGDLSVTWLALDAEVALQSRTNVRWVPVASFFTGYRQTAATADELLVAVRVRPQGVPSGGRRVEWLHKVARRDRVDISTVIAAYSIVIDAAGIVTAARLAYGGVAATPARAIGAEKLMIGGHWSDEGMANARTALAAAFSPIGDVRATASYRARLVTNLFDRCLAETGISRTTA